MTDHQRTNIIMCWHPFFFFPGFGFLFFLIVLLLIFKRPWHRRWWRGRQFYGSPWEKSPEDILAERFAKGEIDENEYNERLTVLKDRKL